MPANPWKNPGCPQEVWSGFNVAEKEMWRRLYRAYNSQINMPPGVHVLDRVVRDLAIQYANVGVWTMKVLAKEKLIATPTEPEEGNDLSGIRSQDEAR